MHSTAPVLTVRPLLIVVLSALVVACSGDGGAAGLASTAGSPTESATQSAGATALEPTSTPEPTNTPEPAIAGVSSECADAMAAFVDGLRDPWTDPASDVIWSCATDTELLAAAEALGADEISSDPSWFLDEACTSWGYDAPACAWAPTPTPYVATIDEDAAWRTEVTDLCLAAQPADLLATSAGVVPLADSSAYPHVWVRIAEYIGVDGIPTTIPPLARGFVYSTAYVTPTFAVSQPGDVELVACVTLQAFEHEQWYPSSQNGCPCYPYDASRAFVWMIDPTTGELVGQPWLRPAADVDHGASTDMLLGGVDHGLGIRPPEQTDLVADIEAFLGR